MKIRFRSGLRRLTTAGAPLCEVIDHRALGLWIHPLDRAAALAELAALWLTAARPTPRA